MIDVSTYCPDWVSCPGDSILDALSKRNLKIDAFAGMLSWPVERARDLLHGEEAITGEVAELLSEIVGGSAAFWLRREEQYRADAKRLNITIKKERSGAPASWLRSLPIKDMVRYGWIADRGRDQAAQLVECLRFFGVSSDREWADSYADDIELVAFRTSPVFRNNIGATSAWLRQGEVLADTIDCLPWNPDAFFKSLPEIRMLTRIRDPDVFLPKLQRICAISGVAVTIARAPRGCSASGAARLLDGGKANIHLSFRYRTDDHFWFTFFHEAGHLLLHSDVGFHLDEEMSGKSKAEIEANEFSEDTLIPPKYRDEMFRLGNDAKAIMRFAKSVGVSPGIVVGQLQFKGCLDYGQQQKLKRRYVWSK